MSPVESDRTRTDLFAARQRQMSTASLIRARRSTRLQNRGSAPTRCIHPDCGRKATTLIVPMQVLGCTGFRMPLAAGLGAKRTDFPKKLSPARERGRRSAGGDELESRRRRSARLAGDGAGRDGRVSGLRPADQSSGMSASVVAISPRSSRSFSLATHGIDGALRSIQSGMGVRRPFLSSSANSTIMSSRV